MIFICKQTPINVSLKKIFYPEEFSHPLLTIINKRSLSVILQLLEIDMIVKVGYENANKEIEVQLSKSTKPVMPITSLKKEIEETMPGFITLTDRLINPTIANITLNMSCSLH